MEQSIEGNNFYQMSKEVDVPHYPTFYVFCTYNGSGFIGGP